MLAGETENTSMRLSDEFARLRDLAAAGPLTLGQFIDALNAKGHAFVCLVLGFPFLTPIPLPGVSIPFGVMILVAAACMALGVPPWMPRRLRAAALPSDSVVKVLDIALRLLRKVESLIRPRGRVFVKFPVVVRLSGVAIAVCASILALPLPPGTNFPPALGVVLVSLGVLEGDAVLLGLGFLVALTNVIVFGAVSLFGFDYISNLWHK